MTLWFSPFYLLFVVMQIYPLQLVCFDYGIINNISRRIMTALTLSCSLVIEIQLLSQRVVKQS